MMTLPISPSRLLALSTLLALSGVSGCVNAIDTMVVADAVKPEAATVDYGKAQECLARAMYFESNRSSETGMLAVGTVVMNRVESPVYPKSVCGVVGQRNQFAPGVMTRAMGPGKDLAMKTAYAVLSGKRHPGVKTAKYFHTAGLKFPYRNMHYVAIAGGNAFYQKVSRAERKLIRMASQSDVRRRQDQAVDEVTTAVALVPPQSERAKASPFASLWQALTEKKPAPAAAGGATASEVVAAVAPQGDARQAAVEESGGKGGRVVTRTAETEANESSILDERMNGLPGVTTGLRTSFAEPSSPEDAGDDLR